MPQKAFTCAPLSEDRVAFWKLGNTELKIAIVYKLLHVYICRGNIHVYIDSDWKKGRRKRWIALSPVMKTCDCISLLPFCQSSEPNLIYSLGN